MLPIIQHSICISIKNAIIPTELHTNGITM